MNNTILTEAGVTTGFDIESAILTLKKQMNAVILAHYYQEPEIQDIADFIGDSLELSRKAAQTDADFIIFCGVKFMAESALILNPGKTVLVPDLKAGCSLEESCPADKFKIFRDQYPDHLALTYINCSAEVKALSDIIVTSSSAEKIINSLPVEQKIIFAPDKHLGNFLIKKTGRDMVLWQGTCIVHENFSEKELISLKARSPKSEIIAHPECPENLLMHADYIGSTSALLKYTIEKEGGEFIVLTEPGIIHQMKKMSPGSIFHEVASLNQAGCQSCSQCPFMRLNSLEKLYSCMKNQNPKISIDPDIAGKAKISLQNMLNLM